MEQETCPPTPCINPLIRKWIEHQKSQGRNISVGQVGKQELLACQHGTGERSGAAWQRCSQRSHRGETLHPESTEVIANASHTKRTHVKARLLHTSNHFLMKPPPKWTIFFFNTPEISTAVFKDHGCGEDFPGLCTAPIFWAEWGSQTHLRSSLRLQLYSGSDQDLENWNENTAGNKTCTSTVVPW